MKISSFLLSISLLAFAFACGSSKSGTSQVASSAAGAVSAAGTAGTASLVVGLDSGGSAGSAGSGGSASSAKNGGVVTLTPDQVTAINNNACDGWSAEPETVPAVLELVVDTSLSMNEVPNAAATQPGRRPTQPAAGTPTKWQSTQAALKTVISALPASIAVGLFFFPNMANQANSTPESVDKCVNTMAGTPPSLLTDTQRATLIAALDATSPNGWTPTNGAYEHALDAALLPTQLPGAKYILLITDGQPTLRLDCTSQGNANAGAANPVETQPIVDAISSALGQGVRTFLIGSPGSEDARAWMSQAAIEGGTAIAGCKVMGPPYCHLDMTTAPDFGAALQAGLRKVTGSIACTYDIPTPGQGQVIDNDLINLVITTPTGATQLVLPDDGTDCTEGWRISGNQVVLCDGTCSRAQSEGDSIQLLFGCQSGSIDIPK